MLSFSGANLNRKTLVGDLSSSALRDMQNKKYNSCAHDTACVYSA